MVMKTKATGRFKTTYYVIAYKHALAGLNDTSIARAMDTNFLTFRKWLRTDPAFRDAVDKGRADAKATKSEETFHEYIVDHLSPDLRPLWQEINRCSELENGVDMVTEMLQGHNTRTRQHLLIFALTQSMFNVSDSLRKLAIPRRTYQGWCMNDPDFHALIEEIHWHKKNFFEQAFIGRVAAGDTMAIIHAVKTKCRDRGYNEKVEVEHTGTVQHTHTIDIAALPLDINTRKAVLEALRAHQAINTTATPVIAP